jgi:hypothetical protein
LEQFKKLLRLSDFFYDGVFNATGRAYLVYQDRAKEWESLYGENAKPKQKSLHERMQEY